MISPGQIRAARAFLNVKQSELAKSAGVALATVNNLERGLGDPRASTLDALAEALAGVGVTFDTDDGRDSVSIARLVRPESLGPFYAGERIMELLQPDSLVKPLAVVFFARRAGPQDQDPGPTATAAPGARHRICAALETVSQVHLFDRSALVLDHGPRAAEVGGVLLSAFANHGDRLFVAERVIADTSGLENPDAARLFERLGKQRMGRPRQLLEQAADWSELTTAFAGWSGHPMQQLLELHPS